MNIHNKQEHVEFEYKALVNLKVRLVTQLCVFILQNRY